MKPTQRQREQELASSVQARLKDLLALLDPDERKTTRSWGSTPAETFEDKARAISQSANDPRAEAVRAFLSAFQEAINAAWTYAIQCRVPERLAATWIQKHRRDAAALPREDIEAEALFALRHQIIRYSAGTDARLEGFASRGVHQHLTEWMARQGPVELPESAARSERPRGYRMPFDSVPESGTSPELGYNAVLDGDVTREDL